MANKINKFGHCVLFSILKSVKLIVDTEIRSRTYISFENNTKFLES